MSLSALSMDAYQLTTLVAHADAGRLAQKVAMAFFFRKVPKPRSFVVFAGLRAVLEHGAQMRFTSEEIAALRAHPAIGPALAARPTVVDALASIEGFEGEIDAVAEGTLLWSGAGTRTDGSPLLVGGVPLPLYVPMLQVRTDIVRAKLIETPWLGYLNHMSMVASKAARVALAARGKTVFEFGSRRAHPGAAVDAAYAAYVAGCAATSNLAAYARYGIPAVGTMDHFAVQASERPGVSVDETERAFFDVFARAFPHAATMLVDTYDTERGLRDVARATGGRCTGVRIDSNVTRETLLRARAILDEAGAKDVKIFASDALDEFKVKDLADVADGFGVGENISCSPDASTGIGAVAKLVVNGYGKITMKLSRGSGKATLPGQIQAWRFADHDLIALASEPAPAGGVPLLRPVWRGRSLAEELPSAKDVRAHVSKQIAALPEEMRSIELPPRSKRALVASAGLVAVVEKLAKEAGIE